MAMTDTTPTTSATPATGKAALRAIAGEIAAQLGETDPEPQRLIGFRWGLLRWIKSLR